MNKLDSTTYKGIKYIRLSTLPAEQAKALVQTLNQRTLIKILKDDIILEDCVLYTAYMQWYESLSTKVVTTITSGHETKLKKQITIA